MFYSLFCSAHLSQISLLKLEVKGPLIKNTENAWFTKLYTSGYVAAVSVILWGKRKFVSYVGMTNTVVVSRRQNKKHHLWCVLIFLPPTSHFLFQGVHIFGLGNSTLAVCARICASSLCVPIKRKKNPTAKHHEWACLDPLSLRVLLRCHSYHVTL